MIYIVAIEEHNNAGRVREMFPTPKEKQTSDKDEWINIDKSNNAKNPDETNDRIVYNNRRPLSIDKLNKIVNYPIIRT